MRAKFKRGGLQIEVPDDVTCRIADKSTTRDKIIEAARYFFSVGKSFDTVPLDAIAQVVGVRSASIYNYFESKEALATIVLDLFLKEALQNADTANDFAELFDLVRNDYQNNLILTSNWSFIGVRIRGKWEEKIREWWSVKTEDGIEGPEDDFVKARLWELIEVVLAGSSSRFEKGEMF